MSPIANIDEQHGINNISSILHDENILNITDTH